MTQPRRVAAVSLAKRVARCELKACLPAGVLKLTLNSCKVQTANLKVFGLFEILKTLNCSEMGSEVGERVGFKVRFQEQSGPNTQVSLTPSIQAQYLYLSFSDSLSH